MKYQTHNEITIDNNGSHLQGYIKADYEELVEAFGLPMADGYDNFKVDAEWMILFEDGTVATIYNWKIGKNYMGPTGLDLDEIHEWNVGGFSKISLFRLAETLVKLSVQAAA